MSDDALYILLLIIAICSILMVLGVGIICIQVTS
jgi:hypothetical protein